MTNELPHPVSAQMRLLALITTPKLAKKASALFHRGGMPMQYRLHAQGTAPNETLEVLGLGGTERVMLLSLLPQPFAQRMLGRLQSELCLAGASNGIACTVVVSGASSLLFQILTAFGDANNVLIPKKDVIQMSGTHFSMILAVVDQGYSDSVMEAARPAGATGGTVISSRWLPNEETMRFWNITVQQEKEIVAILADAEKKHAIMQAIGEHCGVRSEAHGVVVSVPVEDVVGI